MQAQQQTASPVGEYYLEGVRETAAGFRVNADSTFDFFFSYGALDRQGKGHWTMSGNDIIFNSDVIGNDFVLESSEKTPENGIRIELGRTSPDINTFFHAVIVHDGQAQEAQADAHGLIRFPLQKIDTIKLIFEWCPEKVSVFPVSPSDHNRFLFQLQPTIVDVHFIKCTMTMTDKGFSGALPFSNGKRLEFRKSQ